MEELSFINDFDCPIFYLNLQINYQIHFNSNVLIGVHILYGPVPQNLKILERFQLVQMMENLSSALYARLHQKFLNQEQVLPHVLTASKLMQMYASAFFYCSSLACNFKRLTRHFVCKTAS